VLPALCAGNGGYIVNISFPGRHRRVAVQRALLREQIRPGRHERKLAARPFGIHVVLVEPGDFRTQITAKRCVAAASQNSAYRTAFDKFKRKQDQDEAAAPTPEPVARLVERILSHRRPNAIMLNSAYSEGG
jgi:hypothetical protein